MQFDDQQVDAGQLDDRRGMSSGAELAAGAGGIGVVGLLVVLVAEPARGSGGGTADVLDQVLGGGTGVGGPSGGTTSDVERRCNVAGSIDRYEDCYVLKIFNEVNEVWAAALPQSTARRTRTRGWCSSAGGADRGCGQASRRTGPFYCPPDQRGVPRPGLPRRAAHQFGAKGRYAQAYVVAHEVGHHLQNLLGIEPRVRSSNSAPAAGERALGADGAAGRLLRRRLGRAGEPARERADREGGGRPGDDRRGRRRRRPDPGELRRRVDPESFTHGSAAQRQQWFSTGFSSADPGRCDTFSQ